MADFVGRNAKRSHAAPVENVLRKPQGVRPGVIVVRQLTGHRFERHPRAKPAAFACHGDAGIAQNVLRHLRAGDSPAVAYLGIAGIGRLDLPLRPQGQQQCRDHQQKRRISKHGEHHGRVSSALYRVYVPPAHDGNPQEDAQIPCRKRKRPRISLMHCGQLTCENRPSCGGTIRRTELSQIGPFPSNSGAVRHVRASHPLPARIRTVDRYPVWSLSPTVPPGTATSALIGTVSSASKVKRSFRTAKM